MEGGGRGLGVEGGGRRLGKPRNQGKPGRRKQN